MDEMRLIAVNTGRPELIDGHKSPTGICKHPRNGPVMIASLGLEDDAVMDTRNHGGPDQAVYIYGQPDYDFFARELGRELPAGLFGENLTLAGLESRTLHIGDRFGIGDVLLEATSPRIPCATFAARMGDPHWARRFHAARRPGVYVRVLKAGSVAAGMDVRHIPFAGEQVLVTDLMEDYKAPSPERMRRLLKAPIHRDLVMLYEARLAQGDLLA
jgi:MOSC domain-containing protein YiiM